MMFGMKHSLCFTSIVSKAQPSLSMPMKNSLRFWKLRKGKLGIARHRHARFLSRSVWLCSGSKRGSVAERGVVWRISRRPEWDARAGVP